MRSALVLALVLVPQLADARPQLAAGTALGLTQSKLNADEDASRTLGLFARIGLTPRLATQLELQQFRTAPDSYVSMRTWSLALVLELSDNRRWVPTVLGAAGLDHESDEFDDRAHGHHLEGGFGIEYRSDGGLTLGADARIGTRTMESEIILDNAGPPEMGGGGVVFLAPSHLSEGEYRSLRLTLGIRF
jgi:hypothetical protein